MISICCDIFQLIILIVHHYFVKWFYPQPCVVVNSERLTLVAKGLTSLRELPPLLGVLDCYYNDLNKLQRITGLNLNSWSGATL